MANYLHKKLKSIEAFTAGDNTLLKEVLHPKNDSIALPYSLAYASIQVGKSSLPHTLDNKELYYILEGKAAIYIEENRIEVQKGETVLIHENKRQYVENIGDENLCFLCVVSPAWEATKEKILRKN